MSTVAVASSVGESFSSAASTGPLLLALGACVLAGLVSFASPCVVPLVPGYLSYLAGLVGAEAPDMARTATATSTTTAGADGAVAVSTRPQRPSMPPGARLRVAGAALLFVLGFTVVFVLATSAVLGITTTFIVSHDLLQRIGGVITIVMGLAFVGLIPALQREARFHPRTISNLVGAPLLGAVFALGWTPCLGPTLSSVIAAASSTEGTTAVRGVVLIVAYCLGLGLPFILVALGSAWMMQAFGWIRRHARAIQIAGGVLMLAVGILLVSGQWDHFVWWVRDLFVSNATTPI
ncbi:cytochrome c biogenesis CcdA family protein [Gordonia jinhuaensis]|uniref:Cytochrome C biogenesis protein CcdA n=1 Tax=Gordonia jinhuaensis TaxID=1517702 RepID=A0A916WQR4_9ACTN|nr:cytochrome c biogenesis CcdA family protein [Gordonia jinhuaensis]GGB21622.1 cytochrome C biogenesis protein CcdA [Gordonia jinhuaensis]